MKYLLITLSIVMSASAFSQDLDSRVEVMKAEGQKDISMGTLLSPPGLGALGRAKMIAKKNLKAKCASELNGKIVGEVTYETLRFDEGIMAAVVQATGNCKY